MFYHEMGNSLSWVEGRRGGGDVAAGAARPRLGPETHYTPSESSWGCVLGVWKSANTLAPGEALLHI